MKSYSMGLGSVYLTVTNRDATTEINIPDLEECYEAVLKNIRAEMRVAVGSIIKIKIESESTESTYILTAYGHLVNINTGCHWAPEYITLSSPWCSQKELSDLFGKGIKIISITPPKGE